MREDCGVFSVVGFFWRAFKYIAQAILCLVIRLDARHAATNLLPYLVKMLTPCRADSLLRHPCNYAVKMRKKVSISRYPAFFSEAPEELSRRSGSRFREFAHKGKPHLDPPSFGDFFDERQVHKCLPFDPPQIMMLDHGRYKCPFLAATFHLLAITVCAANACSTSGQLKRTIFRLRRTTGIFFVRTNPSTALSPMPMRRASSFFAINSSIFM